MKDDLIERPIPPARRLASAARSILERILVELRLTLQREDLEMIPGVVAVLARLEASELDDPEHLQLLESALAGIANIQERLSAAQEPSAARSSKAVAEAADALRACRTETVDTGVAQQNRIIRERSTTRTTAPERSFRASIGTPQLHSPNRDPLTLWGVLYDRRAPEACSESTKDDEQAELLGLARHCVMEIGLLGVL